MGIRVMLVDDHRMVTEALSSLLSREDDLEVVAIADNGRDAIRLAREMLPEVIVMDLAMPEMNGLEASRYIVSEFPDCRIIALSMHSDRRYVVESLKAGTKGYILKESAFTALAGAIRGVTENNGYLDPKITGIILKDYFQQMKEPAHPLEYSPLTSREREVLQLISEGKNTKETAIKLDISIKTVETHRRQIMNKLNLSNVAEMTRYAIREGVSSL